MSKHTPAPWVVHFRTDGSSYISMGDPNKGPHKAADLFLTADGGESDLADARLIATAPDMLEALDAIANHYDQTGYSGGWKSLALEMAEVARVAIAKATGEA